jgi:hypothetical protein
MPSVTLTEYEVTHCRLPPVCVQCGEPATTHDTRKIRFIDGADGRGVLSSLGWIVGLFCLPPLLIYLFRRAPVLEVRLPYCDRDLGRHKRREWIALRVLIVIWCVYALACDAILITQTINQPLATLIMLGAFLGFMFFLDWLKRRQARRRPPKRRKVTLPGIHPAFAAALAEDRARDRIDNPARRAEHGDVRDDFDDQPD